MLSLGEVAGEAIRRKKVQMLVWRPDSLTLTLGTPEVTLSPDEARLFLSLLLRTSPAADLFKNAAPTTAPEEEPPVVRSARKADEPDLYQKRELFRSNISRIKAEERGSPPSEPEIVPEPLAGVAAASSEPLSPKAYLAAVLTFSKSLGIIEGYETMDAEGKVRISTGATSTILTTWEALEYLSNAMLFEMRDAEKE